MDNFQKNSAQQQAVETTDGPLLIIAGPGAGKTKTLVDRVAHILQTKPVDASNLLVSTFTEKAASELLSRISIQLDTKGIKANLQEMFLGTLHSIFLRILQDYRIQAGLKRSFSLLDPFEQAYLVYRNLKRLTEDASTTFLDLSPTTSQWRTAEELVSVINKVTENGLKSDQLKGHDHLDALGTIYERYLALLDEENVLDFSLIQAKCLFLLQNRPEVLKELREKIHYLMVDEYQDTNPIQEKILLLLAGDRKNLCVVGDDDQALYRFRGATIENILRFPSRFQEGECRTIVLDVNYRSHQGIIKFYDEFMSAQQWHNSEGVAFRYAKEIKPCDAEFKSYTSVLRIGVPYKDDSTPELNQQKYFTEVERFIRHLQESKKLTDLNQVAFLFRSVKGDRVLGLAKFLESKGIPVFSPRSALYFERHEVRLMIGALIFLFPMLDNVLREKSRYELQVWEYYLECKRYFADEIRKEIAKHKPMLTWLNERVREHLNLERPTTYAFTALIYRLLAFPMFADLVHVTLKESAFAQRASYNLSQLTQIFHRFEGIHDVSIITEKSLPWVLRTLFNGYLRYLIDGGIEEYEDFEMGKPSGAVSFMTIHQSKGLEFPVVICGSLNSVPRSQNSDLDLWISEIEGRDPYEPMDQIKNFDFWRVFYTAFSRAQNLLVLSAMEREGHGREPSKYFDSWYFKLPNWQKADLRELQLVENGVAHIKKQYAYTSDVLLFENCSLQYKFYKEIGFAESRIGGAIGGSLLHQTIEDMHRHVLEGKTAEIHADNVSLWFDENYNLLQKTQGGYLSPGVRRSLLEQAQNYRCHQEKNWEAIVQAEVDVSLVKDKYILNGTIDLIRNSAGALEIVDFKSGKKPDIDSDWGRKMLRQYQRQLEIYAHLVEERTGHGVQSMKLYYAGEADSNPYVTFTRSEMDIGKTIAQVDKVIDAIERKDFKQSDSAKCDRLCSNCDFRFFCNPGKYE